MFLEPVALHIPKTLTVDEYNRTLDFLRVTHRVWEFTRAEMVAFANGYGWNGFLRERGYNPRVALAFYCTDGRWFVASPETRVAS